MTLLENLMADPCGFFTAGLMLVWMANFATEGKPVLRKFGAALAGAALMFAFLHGLLRRTDVLLNLIASVGFGLFVLGGCWVVLALISFIFSCLPRPRSPSTAPKPKPEKPIVIVKPPEPVSVPDLVEEQGPSKQQVERDKARQEALAFYQDHADLLRSVFPPALFRTQLQCLVPDDASPDKAWEGSKNLVAHLQALIERERDKQKQLEAKERVRQKKQQRIQAEIDEYQRRIDRFRVAPMDEETRQEEITSLEERIRQLQVEIQELGDTDETTIQAGEDP